jgi:hypothetical protein
MNQLSQENIDYLIKLINSANPARITSVIVDNLGTRAIDESGTIALMDPNVPEFPGHLGLTRIPQLKARLELASGKDDFTVEYHKNEDKGFVERLTFKARGVKADYRTGDPESIRAPKRIMDEMVTEFELDNSVVSELQSAVGAYTATELKFILKDGSISAQVDDGNGDVFSVEVGNTDYTETLTHVYDALNTSQILKLSLTNGKVKVAMGEKGILSIFKDPFTFYVMPSKRG